MKAIFTGRRMISHEYLMKCSGAWVVQINLRCVSTVVTIISDTICKSNLHICDINSFCNVPTSVTSAHYSQSHFSVITGIKFSGTVYNCMCKYWYLAFGLTNRRKLSLVSNFVQSVSARNANYIGLWIWYSLRVDVSKKWTSRLLLRYYRYFQVESSVSSLSKLNFFWHH